MYTSQFQIRVRYADTDQMGYVYYGNYATFYEIGRVESLRQLGLTYKSLEESGVMMPVLENHSKFFAPARYDELLTIETTLIEMPAVRITFFYKIFNEQKNLIHEGETKLAFIDMKTNRPCRMPKIMADVLQPYFA